MSFYTLKKLRNSKAAQEYLTTASTVLEKFNRLPSDDPLLYALKKFYKYMRQPTQDQAAALATLEECIAILPDDVKEKILEVFKTPSKLDDADAKRLIEKTIPRSKL